MNVYISEMPIHQRISPFRVPRCKVFSSSKYIPIQRIFSFINILLLKNNFPSILLFNVCSPLSKFSSLSTFCKVFSPLKYFPLQIISLPRLFFFKNFSLMSNSNIFSLSSLKNKYPTHAIAWCYCWYTFTITKYTSPKSRVVMGQHICIGKKGRYRIFLNRSHICILPFYHSLLDYLSSNVSII